MKKKIVFIIVLFITLFSTINCTNSSKNNQQNQSNIMYIPDTTVNAQSFVSKVLKKQVSYPNLQQVYYFHAQNYHCHYEVLVNDFPVKKYFEDGYQATPSYINMAILKSGKQTLTYRLYPKPGYGTFPEETEFILIIGTHVKNPPTGTWSDTSKQLLEHRCPKKKVKWGEHKDKEREGFIAEGQKYFEYTIEFDATVPYTNKGWSEGEDLTKFDRDELYRSVLAYYNEYKKIYDTHNADLLAQVNYPFMCEYAQAKYFNEKDIQEAWDEYVEMLNVEKEFFPMDNIKMELFGNGRVVCLRQAEDKDLNFKNQSALFFKFEDEDYVRGYSLGLYLYLPKGKKLGQLRPV